MYRITLFLIVIVVFISSCKSDMEKSEEHFNQALYHIKYIEYDQAILSLDEVIKLDPQNFEAYFNKGNCYMNMGKYNKAIDSYTNCIEVKPDYYDAFSNRGQAYFYLKDNQAACADYKKADELGKPNMEDKLRHCK